MATPPNRLAPFRIIIAPLVAGLLASAAGARQEGSPQSPLEAKGTPSHRDWTLKIDPAAWYASAEGNLKMPGAAGSTQNTFDLGDFDLDEPQWTPVGFVHLRLGDWRFSGGGFAFSTGDQDANAGDTGQLGRLSIAQGDRTRSSLDFWSLEFQVAYRLINTPLGTTQSGDPRIVFELEPVLGLRAYSVDVEVKALSGASAGLNTKADETFVEPTVAVRMGAEFVKQFTLEVQTGFGVGPWGDTQSFSWDIEVAGVWRPIPNLGVRIGYRHLLFDLQSGSGADQFEMDGSIAGLFAGVELRF